MRLGKGHVLLAALVVSCARGDDGDLDASSPVDASLSDVHDAKPDIVDASSGDAALCSPGTTRCSATQLGVETCATNGTWGSPVACDSQTCVGGACAGKCAQGQTQCNGTSIQTCDTQGNWVDSKTCPVACCDAACVDTGSDTNNCGKCGNACAAGSSCGTTFSAFTGTQSSNWTANGSAIYDGTNNAAQLTSAASGGVGTWIYNHELYVDDVTFKFDFYAGDGTGADGMGFMLETTGTTAVGGGGGGLGMAGLTGFGVELDHWNNNECSDTTANHLAIDTLAVCGKGEPTALTVNNSPGFTIRDATWHTMTVQVTNGDFTVVASGTTQFTKYTAAGWTNGLYYLGFAGACGGSTDTHSVRNVSVTFNNAAHCY